MEVGTARETGVSEQTVRKITRRLVPMMVLMYIIAYIDKTNLGFAGLQMMKALDLRPAVFGFGAGVFFVGYTIFEVPSNLILHRVGARVWMARIMITWGLISAAMAFTTGETSFYLLRFFLGAAEAGFFPGMILYMTFWFPARERARITSFFIMSTPLAVIIASPASGAILSLDGIFGIEGWRWLFLLEGLPAVLLSIVVFKYLTDKPEDADWLRPDEREWLIATLAEEAKNRKEKRRFTVVQALANPRVILFGVLYFGLLLGINGVVIWMPQVIKASGLSNLGTGFVVAIPYAVAVVTMVLVARHSDKTGERTWHVAIPALVGGIGLIISATAPSPIIQLVGVILGVAGLYTAMSPFWALPTAYLSGAAAAGGLAWITSIANLGGLVGPWLIGYVKEITGSYTYGIASMAAGGFLSFILALVLSRGPAAKPQVAAPKTA